MKQLYENAATTGEPCYYQLRFVVVVVLSQVLIHKNFKQVPLRVRLSLGVCFKEPILECLVKHFLVRKSKKQGFPGTN